MLDIDLLYVKFRQQELWQEAATRGLAARLQPEGRRWWVWVVDALTALFSGHAWWASGPRARHSFRSCTRC